MTQGNKALYAQFKKTACMAYRSEKSWCSPGVAMLLQHYIIMALRARKTRPKDCTLRHHHKTTMWGKSLSTRENAYLCW